MISVTKFRPGLGIAVGVLLILFGVKAGEAQTLCKEERPLKIVVLGSSTAAGFGVSEAESWVGQLEAHLQVLNASSEVINLAKQGYSTYHILPTGTTTEVKSKPDPYRNITQALAHEPDGIIVNLPSNDTWYSYPVEDQLANYRTVYQLAQDAGVPMWIASQQPRDRFAYATRIADLKEISAALHADYPGFTFDFWTGLVNEQDSIRTEYAYGDGIHINAAGQSVLFQEVVSSDFLSKLQEITYPAHRSRQGGSFQDPNSWQGGQVPASGADVIIEAAHSIYLDQNVPLACLWVQAGASLDLADKQLDVSCEFTVDGEVLAEDASLLLHGSRNISLPTLSRLHTLILNKSAGQVSLSASLEVSNLQLIQGMLHLNGQTLSGTQAAFISGGSPTSYLNAEGGGKLIQPLNASLLEQPLILPLGDATSYSPVDLVFHQISGPNPLLEVDLGHDVAGATARQSTALLGRYWRLKALGMESVSYDLACHFVDADVAHWTSEELARAQMLQKAEGAGWVGVGLFSAPDHLLSASNLNSFGLISAGDPDEGTPLPVGWLSFSAEQMASGEVELNWCTATETNNDYFLPEHSVNGSDWISLDPLKGAGTSAEARCYQLSHRPLAAAYNYYRIKQVDFDGRFSYSETKVVSANPLAEPTQLLASPNPVLSGKQLQVPALPGLPARVFISNLQGQGVGTVQLDAVPESGKIAVAISLPAGMYCLSLQQASAQTRTRFVVK